MRLSIKYIHYNRFFNNFNLFFMISFYYFSQLNFRQNNILFGEINKRFFR